MTIEIIKGKPYISVEEVTTYLAGLREDLERERQNCLEQNKKLALPQILPALNNVTNVDYDFFLVTIGSVIDSFKEHVDNVYSSDDNKGGAAV